MTQPWPYPVNSIGLLTGMEGLAYPEVVTSPATYTQYSTDLLDYSINWADFLMAGDAIATSEWTVDTGLVLGATAFTAASTTVWVTSGSAGHTYRAVNTVTTRGGRDATRVLKFRIKQLNPTGPYFAVAGYLIGGGRLSA